MVTKVCFVGEGFTRKPPKYERFIRPMVIIILFNNNIFTLKNLRMCFKKDCFKLIFRP